MCKFIKINKNIKDIEMVKKRINVEKLYDFLVAECENAKNNINIINMHNGEQIPFPSDCFIYNNDKTLSKMLVLEFIKSRNNDINVIFNILDAEFDYNISNFLLKDLNKIDSIAEPIFKSIEIFFKRESKIKFIKESLLKKVIPKSILRMNIYLMLKKKIN